MNELEKVQAYIHNTRTEKGIENYGHGRLRVSTIHAFCDLAQQDTSKAIIWAFEYGLASGYRAAKAEAKQHV